MNGESTTLCTAREQGNFFLFFAAAQDFNVFYFHLATLSDLFAVCRLRQGEHVHGSFESGTNFRLQGRFLRRYLICITAASAKSESQGKQAGKQNKTPCFLRETAQLLAAAVWHYLCNFKLKVSVLEPGTL